MLSSVSVMIGLGILIVLLLITIALITPAVLVGLAEQNLFFTLRKTNHIKYVERGDQLDHMIAEVPGYILDNPYSEEAEFRKARNGEKQPCEVHPVINGFLARHLGIYYYGLWPFKHIRTFKIKKEYDNVQGTNPSNWIRHGQEAEVDALRFQFPRPFVFTEIELSDRLTVDIKTVAELQVVKPYIPVYVFHGDFFTQTASLLQGQEIDILKGFDIDTFVTSPKGENGGLLSALKDSATGRSAFNETLISSVGLKLEKVSINDYKLSNDEIAKAIQQKALAKEKGEASKAEAELRAQVTVIDAEANAKKTVTQAEADGKAIERRGVAIQKSTQALKEALTVEGADADIIARGLADIRQAEALASKDSSIEVLALGQSSPFLPLSRKEKVEKKEGATK